DNELELARLHDRQVRWLGTLEDAARIDTGLTIGVGNVGAIAHQPADFGKFSARVDRGGPGGRCVIKGLHTAAVEEAVVYDGDGIGRFAGKRGKRRVDCPAAAGAEELDL